MYEVWPAAELYAATERPHVAIVSVDSFSIRAANERFGADLPMLQGSSGVGGKIRPGTSLDNSSTIGRTQVEQQIRSILSAHGRLSVDVAQLDDEASLYQAGLTSHASVNLMLALEDHFGIEFPERMLRRRTFENIASIKAAVEELTGGNVSAA
jgi:acyl carrier protein